MANVLGELFGEIAESIRSKTGDTATMKPAQFPEKISAIKTPSIILPLSIAENGTYTAPAGVDGYNPIVVDVAGSSAELRYVTFLSYDGSFEYGKKAVAVGDDCADPIARGIFAKPTRESDAQYNYTFYGWATTPNGAADSNALKAVNEDRTVYANFSAAVRYYTITYYDSDGATVLKTESLAYGVMPSASYVPEKDGYKFNGWTTELKTVTSDEAYYATWIEAVSFADAPWVTIAAKSADGTASQMWAVGDTKIVPFTYPDGKVENLTVAIAGFNHDVLASGNGKAGISLVCMTTPTEKVVWSTSNSSDKTYATCSLKSTLEEWVTYLPEALQSVIKDVNKQYDSGWMTSSTKKTVSCKLWALSLAELGYTNAFYQISLLGSRYALFPTVTGDGTTSPSGFDYVPPCDSTLFQGPYWLRQGSLIGEINAYTITKSGQATYVRRSSITSETRHVRFGFCV